MVRRLFRNVLIFGILVCATGAIAFAALCRQINRTGERDEAQPADAIVILGAGAAGEMLGYAFGDGGARERLMEFIADRDKTFGAGELEDVRAFGEQTPPRRGRLHARRGPS